MIGVMVPNVFAQYMGNVGSAGETGSYTLEEALAIQANRNGIQIVSTDKGTLNVKLSYKDIKPDELIKLPIEFINPITQKTQVHVDYKITITESGKTLFQTPSLIHTSEGIINGFKFEFPKYGLYQIKVDVEGILFTPINPETVSLNVLVVKEPITIQTNSPNYVEGETIVISGNISKILENEKITLQLFKHNNLVEIIQLNVSQDGNYSTTINAWGPLWQTDGVYVVRATYGENNFSETLFDYRLINSSITVDEYSVQNDIILNNSALNIDKKIYNQEDLMTISGVIKDNKKGIPLILILTNPDGTTTGLIIPTTDEGKYETFLQFSSEYELGEYSILSSYGSKILGKEKFSIQSKSQNTYSVPAVAATPEPIFLGIASFVDQSKDPQHYIDRYNNEPTYKQWFDENYPQYSSIYEAVGLDEPVVGQTTESEYTPEPVFIPEPVMEQEVNCGPGTELVNGVCQVIQTIEDTSNSIAQPTGKCENLNPGALLMNCNLSGMNLIHRDLHGVNFSGANLSEVQFGNSNLQSVNFSGANLEGASLVQTNLRYADFSNANLEGATFGTANLRGANFINANLDFAELQDVDIEMADFSGASLFNAQIVRVELDDCALECINFRNTDLRSTDFTGSNLKGANFSGANLEDANFDNVELDNADFSNANLSYALINTSARYVDFSNADLQNANLSGSVLILSNFQKANLEGADLWDSDMSSSNFSNANLTNADLSEAQMVNSNFSNADVTRANIWGTDFTNASINLAIGVDTTVTEKWDGTEENSYVTTSKENPCGEGTIYKDGECILDKNGGGCLIATATYGSEMATEVQQLRELRDNQLLNTESGTAFMGTFNDIYYSFSPIIADYERENPLFKEAVKLAITPMISTLSLMENANSESEVLSIGISVIMLNLGMYLGVPAIVIIGIRKIK
jgi:uncharacterized protein YjbI with pentapeptide repeats